MIEGIQAAEIIQQAQKTEQPDGVEFSPENREIESENSTQSFADVLSNAINGVDETMKTSQKNIEAFVAGETDNVHDVMISMQRAKMSFKMMVEVRNKAIEAYQEVSRMQI